MTMITGTSFDGFLEHIAEELTKLNNYLEASAGIQELKESIDEMNLSIRALGTSFENAFESIFVQKGAEKPKETYAGWSKAHVEEMLMCATCKQEDVQLYMCRNCNTFVCLSCLKHKKPCPNCASSDFIQYREK